MQPAIQWEKVSSDAQHISDSDLTSCAFPVLFSPPDLRLALFSVALDFRRLIKSKQEVMATLAVQTEYRDERHRGRNLWGTFSRPD